MVEVKGIEAPPGAGRVAVPAPQYHRLAHSNLPGLLLAVDVKHNEHYFAWPPPGLAGPAAKSVRVPVRLLDDAARDELRDILTGDAARALAPELAAAA